MIPKMHRLLIWFMVTLCSLLSMQAWAQEEAGNTQDYVKAYNICSPVAHNLTKQECSFASIMENLYQQCMQQYGFSDEQELDPTTYENYMKSHDYCSNSANQQAQSSCNYGTRYQGHYARCMAKYGFDGNGNRITQPGDEQNEGTEGFEFNF